jgi:hypothetical protein
MKRIAAILGLAAAAWAAPAAAQGSIRAGMTADDVRAAFGAPATVREAGGWTYLFYHNGCPRRCGSDDVVFLQDGRVVAAVLRTGRRRMEGPPAAVALEALDPGPPGDRTLLVDGDDDRDAGAPAVLRVRQRGDEEGAETAPARRAAPGAPALRYRTGGERMGTDSARAPAVGGVRIRTARDTAGGRRPPGQPAPEPGIDRLDRDPADALRPAAEGSRAPAPIPAAPTPPDTTRRTGGLPPARR